MKINTRSITLSAVLTALCFALGAAPGVFFLPSMVAATTLNVGMTAFVGLAYGCVSLMYSFIMPSSPVSIGFTQAPYIAIIPRILAALGAFGVYRLIMRLAKPTRKVTRGAAVAAGAVTGSLLNTALVVGLFVLVMPTEQMLAYVPTMFMFAGIEVACMAVLTPPISITLQDVVLKKRTKKKPLAQTVTADGAIDALTDIASGVEQQTPVLPAETIDKTDEIAATNITSEASASDVEQTTCVGTNPQKIVPSA